MNKSNISTVVTDSQISKFVSQISPTIVRSLTSPERVHRGITKKHFQLIIENERNLGVSFRFAGLLRQIALDLDLFTVDYDRKDAIAEAIEVCGFANDPAFDISQIPLVGEGQSEHGVLNFKPSHNMTLGGLEREFRMRNLWWADPLTTFRYVVRQPVDRRFSLATCFEDHQGNINWIVIKVDSSYRRLLYLRREINPLQVWKLSPTFMTVTT